MTVDFYFGPGSRYSYLAATQLDRLTAETGTAFRWRCVLSADLTARTGGTPRSPQDPAWRLTDVTRWAAPYGVPFVDVPADAVDWRALALTCVAADLRGEGEAFARQSYATLYGEGLPPVVTLGAAERSAAEAAYAANLEAALAAGAFGVPTFVCPDGAVFWGQDRLPLLRDHLLL